MDLMVLAVPGCPNAMLLEERLAQVLAGRRDVSVSRQVIEDEQEAARRGMHGSPTILVDGIDPFAEPGQPAARLASRSRDGPTARHHRLSQAEQATVIRSSPRWHRAARCRETRSHRRRLAARWRW